MFSTTDSCGGGEQAPDPGPMQIELGSQAAIPELDPTAKRGVVGFLEQGSGRIKATFYKINR